MSFLCPNPVLLPNYIKQIFECGSFMKLNLLKASVLGMVATITTFFPLKDTYSQESETRIENAVAEFSGIDKITGRIIKFDVYIGETVQFGALQVTPRVCYSRPITETPKTTSFLEVDEITLDRKIRRIFTGWMFADSPGLNAVEHSIYDIWLNDCKQESDIAPPSDN